VSDALIASLNARVGELTTELAQVRQEAKARRIENKQLKADRETLAAERDTLAVERDDFKAKATAAPNEIQKKLDEATAALRSRDHRDAFKAAIGDQLADKVAVEKLWAEVDYKPGEALPTPESIQELVGKAREAAPYLFKSDPGGSQQPQPKAPLAGAVGGGRGGPDNAGRFTVRKADLQDGQWIDDNWGKYQAAVKDGTVAYLP
jgi:septal ring factor EnvC (AmiA/AmiB activator)